MGLCETRERAEETGIDKDTRLHGAGLDDYLVVIFPEIKPDE